MVGHGLHRRAAYFLVSVVEVPDGVVLPEGDPVRLVNGPVAPPRTGR